MLEVICRENNTRCIYSKLNAEGDRVFCNYTKECVYRKEDEALLRIAKKRVSNSKPKEYRDIEDV